MKKRKLFLLPLVLFAMSISACHGSNNNGGGQEGGGETQPSGGDDTPTDTTVAVNSVSLNFETLTLTVDETKQLTATVLPDNATDKAVTWETSNSAIATVADGLVTAKAQGNANITAKAGGKSATCSVVVNPKQGGDERTLTGITVSGNKAEYHVGDNLDDLVVTAHFSDNTEVVVPKADYTVSGFDSSQPAQNVTVTVSYGGQTATFTCNIVADPITSYTVSFDLNGGSGSIPSSQVVEGGTFTFPDPENLTSFGAPEGYHFAKWVVGTAEYDPGQTLVINENTVVKAKWEENEPQPQVNYYSITYKPGEGTGAEISFGNIQEGTVIALRDNMFGDPDGKQFKAWLIEGVEYAEGASYTLNGNVDAVAQWELIPTKSYALVMVDGENETTEDLEINTSAGTNIETGEPVEYKIQDVELAKGQQFIIQLARDDWRGWSQVKLSDNANKDFEEGDVYGDEHLIKTKQAGHYNFWIRTTPETSGEYQGKSIWAEENFHFIAVEAEYNGLIMPGGHFDESKVVVTLTYEDNSKWNNVPASLCTFKLDDETITASTAFAAGEHEIKVLCAGLQSTFKIEVAEYENFIRYRHLDNWHDVELKENPNNSNELYIENGINLAAEDEFVLYADGAWRHYEDLEDGITGFEDINGNIKVTSSDCYDIYYKLDSEEFWIGAHVNYYSIHFDRGIATSGSMEDVSVAEGSEYTLPTANGHFGISNYLFIGWKIQGDDTLYKEGDKITIDDEITLVAQWEEFDRNWYLFGNFNSWSQRDNNYLLEKGTKDGENPGNGVDSKKEGYDQYFINGVVLEKADEFKFEQGNVDNYCPANNIVVPKAGTYNIYVCPSSEGKGGISEWGGASYYLHRTDVVTYTVVGVSSWEVDDASYTLSHRTVAEKEQAYYEGLYLGKDVEFKIVLDTAWEGALDYSNLSTETINSGNFSEEDHDKNIHVENAGYYDIVVDVESGEISITKQQVNVNFKANDEQITPDVIKVDRGTQYTLPANTYPVPSGYRFDGWDDGVNNYQAGEIYEIDEDITFTAVWVQVFTVSFDANGGEGEIASVTVDANNPTTLPICSFTAPSGQQFKCWKVGDDEYTVGQSLFVDSNKVVKAIWEDIPATKYDVTFNANGGSGSMEPVEAAGTYVLPANGFTAPANKQFKCWDVNGAELNPGQSIIVNDDVEILAVWENVYTVSFAANGGSGTMSPVNKVDGESYTLPECTFTAPEGKKFAGWLIDSDSYVVGDVITVDANITVTAVWVHKQYSLKINYDDVVNLVDDSANKPEGAFAQYKATVDISVGDVITFYYDGAEVKPGASGTGNNAGVSGEILVAYESGNDLDLYLKVYKDEHGVLSYDVWFFGFQYYLVGGFNSWTQKDSEYKLTVDPLDGNHYSITGVELSKNTELKVISSKLDWFGDGSDNNVITGANGVYTIDFYVSVNEGVSHINLTKTGEYDPGDVVYYLVGGFNSWKQKDDAYKLTLVGENHYQITGVVLEAGVALKVIGVEGTTTNWYRNNTTYDNCGYSIGPASDYNIIVTAAGTYTIDFYTDNLGGNPVTFTLLP